MDINPEIISLINEIKEDKVHGASELARQAAEALRITAELSQAKNADRFLQELKEAGGQLKLIRPAMASVFNIITVLLDRVTAKAGDVTVDSLRRAVVSEVEAAIYDSLGAVTRIAKHGAGQINDGDKIITHSYSSTVVTMLETTFAKRSNIDVIVIRSGTGRSGEALATQLSEGGIPVTFIDDAAMGLYMPIVNKVVVGADRICVDGSLINGIGTYPLAVMAQRFGLPFYVLCETLKFDLGLKGGEVDLEEKDPAEVAAPGVLPPEVKVKNTYFDITSSELIAGVITENGLFTSEEVIIHMEQLKKATQGIPEPESL
jgi:translation initiation factor eIF-2B subunit delta